MVLVSFAWSLLSGFGSINQSSSTHADNYVQRIEWQKELDTTLTAEAIETCKNDSICPSQDRRDRKTYIRSELESGRYPRNPNKDRSDSYVGWALLLALAAVPLASFTFARILANAAPIKPKREPLTVPEVDKKVPGVPKLGTIAKTRELLKKKTEPEADKITKTGTKKEPKETKKDIPNEAETKMLVAKYKEMKADGVKKIGQKALAGKSKMRITKVAWWLKYGELPNLSNLPAVIKKD
mgnify:CR=1 FL=1